MGVSNQKKTERARKKAGNSSGFPPFSRRNLGFKMNGMLGSSRKNWQLGLSVLGVRVFPQRMNSNR
jgi:hypothetical protein